MVEWTRKIAQKALANRFGTPLYIFNPDQLTRNARDFIALTGDPASVAYPVKSNPSLAVLRVLASLGCAADCAAEQEVRLALMAGIPYSSIVYNSPVPDRALLASLYLAGATVVADSEPILRDLALRVAAAPHHGKLLLRVNPREPVEYLHHEDWQSLTSHSSSAAKFGIPSEELPGIAATCPLPIDGLHIHVGTQMDHLAPFEQALALLHHLADEIAARTGRPLSLFDLGGGLGIGFQPGQQFPSPAAYVEALRPALRPGCRYLVEPGHALVGNAVALLAQVREIKQIRGRRWALLNVGTDQLAKVTLLHWPHQILGPNGQPLPSSGPDAIGGPHCFAGDVLLPQTRLDSLAIDDTVLIQNVGAYCFALANHFNGLLGPAHVAVDDSGECPTLHQRAEDWFFEPGSVGYTWPHSLTGPGRSRDPALVQNLGSPYLRLHSAQDEYSFLSVEELAPHHFRFLVQAASPLGLVTMPFAIRIAGDASIIAALHSLGKSAKDLSVWGTRLAMTAEATLPTDSPLELRLTTTPPIHRNARPRATAHWEFNGGVFHGSFRMTW
jgi:diaminopimelate decarboxylase